MTHIGIIGLGSIGRRHASVFGTIEGVTLSALRSGGKQDAPAGLPPMQVFADPAVFWNSALDGVVVATPTALHGEALHALLAADRVSALIEKPLVGSRAELPDGFQRLEHRVRVAYCLRFHPLVAEVTRLLNSGAVGRPVRASLSFGYHLPLFHPGADHRKEYSARADLGGGALRTMSHELDLVRHWLGRVAAVAGDVRRLSDVTVDADDSVALILRTESGVQVMVDIDFLSPTYRRTGWISGTEGRMEYCFSAHSVRVDRYDGTQILLQPETADMYLLQAMDFVGFVRGEKSAAGTLSQSIELLRCMEAAETISPLAELSS